MLSYFVSLHDKMVCVSLQLMSAPTKGDKFSQYCEAKWEAILMISIHNSIKAFMRSKQPEHVTVESNTGQGNHIRIFIPLFE